MGRYVYDNDMHIHSNLSDCSHDEMETPQRILQYAKDNHLTTIVLTDHLWDDQVKGSDDWYAPQTFAHICQSRPLPQAEGIRFLFGAETELNGDMVLGISREHLEELDFLIIPIDHFHMVGYTISEEDASTVPGRVNAWIRRFRAVLEMDLPFHKIGLAHLASDLLGRDHEEYLRVLQAIPQETLDEIFEKCAQLGIGIELNSYDMNFKEEDADVVLRMFRTAKKHGCKFYLGSDAHEVECLEQVKPIFERAIDLLELTEDDKFRLGQ